jgi:uncharacterized protein (TIGR02118 family)
MLKQVFLIVRKDGWSYDEFIDYFMERHVPLVSERPDLKRYTASFLDDYEYDAVAELYYESREIMKASAESEVGQRAFEDATQFLDMDRTVDFTVDEIVHIDE